MPSPAEIQVPLRIFTERGKATIPQVLAHYLTLHPDGPKFSFAQASELLGWADRNTAYVLAHRADKAKGAAPKRSRRTEGPPRDSTT